ncbi:hypothetical protein DFH06DRAFT_1365359 [Mycena polygramma]|nr:hypothetical protein DFH06DRAFT_1365359 [Mycena polygramma]
MHRCLSISEIIEAICATLDPTIPMAPMRWRREARATLAALASTSTIMSGPALDMLWRSQNQIGNFLGLLPSDLIALFAEANSVNGRVWRLVRPIMVSDWERLLVYAPRVRVLQMSVYSPEKHSEIILALSSCCPSGVLFPNLTCFVWLERSPGFPWRIFCSPNLKQIVLALEGSNTATSLLSTLALSCPRLRHVTVTFRSGSDHGDKATSMFLCGLQDIEGLKIAGILDSLATLDPLCPPAFSCLGRLTLGPLETSRATQFFGILARCPIVWLRIVLCAYATLAETDALFGSLQIACSHTSLRSFSLVNTVTRLFPPDAQGNYMINSHSLGTLSCYSDITTLSIVWPIGFDLDDAAIHRLPRLEDLTLETVIMSAPTRVTLNSLHSLAVHCPQLHSMDMEFDSTSVPTNVGPDRVVHMRLYILGVGYSPIIKPAAVARYLSSLFPKLASITTAREDESNDDPPEGGQHAQAILWHQLWKLVEEYIPEFLAAREEERVSAPPSFCYDSDESGK